MLRTPGLPVGALVDRRRVDSFWLHLPWLHLSGGPNMLVVVGWLLDLVLVRRWIWLLT